MNDDVVELVDPGWVGSNRELYDLVPDWPVWLKHYPRGPDGRILAPNFISHFNGHEFAVRGIGEDLSSSSENGGLAIRSTSLCRLVREPANERTAWDWSSHVHLESLNTLSVDRIDHFLAQVRMRLPDLATQGWRVWTQTDLTGNVFSDRDIEFDFPVGHVQPNVDRHAWTSEWPKWARYTSAYSDKAVGHLFRTCLDGRNYLMYQQRQTGTWGPPPEPSLLPSILIIYLRPTSSSDEHAWTYLHAVEIEIKGLAKGVPAEAALAKARVELPSLVAYSRIVLDSTLG
jgi:hypothetical protein